MKLSDLYFISNVCTGDYMNVPLSCECLSPLCKSSSTEEDFIKIMNNFSSIDYEKQTIVPYQDVKVVRRGYTWKAFNKSLGVDTDKTFGIRYQLSGSSDSVEAYYRHYELNSENLEKIQRRIVRARQQ